MTPAINLLKKLKIPHKLYPYECEAHDDFGKHAATQLGLPEAQVFKTLVAHHDKQAVVAIVPSSGMCSLKQLAKATGLKKVEMMKPAEAEKLTGYKVGGIIVVMGWLVHGGQLAGWIGLRLGWTCFGVMLALLSLRLFWPARTLSGCQARLAELFGLLATELERRGSPAARATMQPFCAPLVLRMRVSLRVSMLAMPTVPSSCRY